MPNSLHRCVFNMSYSLNESSFNGDDDDDDDDDNSDSDNNEGIVNEGPV